MNRRLIRLVVFILPVLLLGAVGVAGAQALTFAPKTDFAAGDTPQAVATGDFNGDGHADLAVADWWADSVSILLGDGLGGFATPATHATGGNPCSVAVGDFNGDTKLDLAVANNYSGDVSILLGDGAGGFGAATDYSMGDWPQGVAVADFNGDTKLDLAVVNGGDNNVVVRLGAGNGTFGAPASFATGSNPSSVSVGDFNEDGDVDLAVTNLWSASVSILPGDGSGGFGAKIDSPAGTWPRQSVVGDFDGDGHLDLATANQNGTNVHVLLGDGAGAFSDHAHYTTGAYSFGLTAADFDGDGNADLAVGTWVNDKVTVLTGAGDGTFGSPIAYGGGSGPFALVAPDLNGDGRPDIVAANNYSGNNVSVLLNEAPAGTLTIEGGATTSNTRLVRLSAAIPHATQMRLCDEGDAWTAWQPYEQYTYWTLPAGDGAKTVDVQYRTSVDTAPIAATVILLDMTAPSTTDDAAATWMTTSPATVHLTPADGDGSGVAATQYKVDGDASWTTGTTVSISGDGIHTLRYRSADEAGNVEETQVRLVRVDGHAPAASLPGVNDLWHNAPVLALVQASDAGSGVQEITYSLDGAAFVAGSGLLVRTDGDHTFDYAVTDWAGNTTGTLHAHIRIDTHRPTTSGHATSAYRNKKATFRVLVTDAKPGSPTAKVMIVIKNAKKQIVKILPSVVVPTNAWRTISWAKCALAKGRYFYVVRATDAAGNWQSRGGGNWLVVK